MQPERDIEKLLKAAAERRRREAGAPFELHPATRQMLQGEVARQLRQPVSSGVGLLGLLARYRFRIAFAASTLAVLGIGVWMLQPRPPGNRPVGQLADARLEKAKVPLARKQVNEVAPTSVSAPLPPPSPKPTDATTEMARSQVATDERGKADLAISGRAGGGVAPRTQEVPLRPAPAAKAGDKEVAPFAAGGATSAALAPTASAPNEVAQPPAAAEPQTFYRKYGLARLSEGAATNAVAAPMPTAESSSTAGVALAFSQQKALVAVDALQPESRDRDQQRSTPPATLAAPAPSAVPAVRTVARSDLSVGANVAQQRFTQAFQRSPAAAKAVAVKLPATSGVLTDFRLEQTGDKIEIIDNDGSTYSGSVQLADAASANLGEQAAAVSKEESLDRKLALRSAPAAPTLTPTRSRQVVSQRAKEAERTQQVLSFRVVGTNRTLNQAVVFNGGLFTVTNTPGQATPAQNSTLARRDTPAAAQAPMGGVSQAQSQFQNLRLTGKALIGGKQEVEINAQPVQR